MYINHQENIVRVLIAVVATLLLPACSVMQLSAQHSCVDGWGRSIPEAERTRENCIYTWTPAELTASLNQRPAQPSARGTQVPSTTGQVTQVYLPTGGYQITRSGGTVFVNQTSRR